MNLRFIKPSQTFYNQIMGLWFKFLHLKEEEAEESIIKYKNLWSDSS